MTAAPRIRIVNITEEVLHDVQCTFSTTTTTWTDTVDSLVPGASIETTKITSDLYVISIEYTLGDQHCRWDDGVISTPGETAILRISAEGSISVLHK
jgi:hypothetical protein